MTNQVERGSLRGLAPSFGACADGPKDVSEAANGQGLDMGFPWARYYDTDKCRKLGKHQYDPSERITGNGFDIGNYEQISTAEKQHMLKELTWFIMSEGYETINEFTQPALERFGEQYWEIMVSYSAFLVKYLNGNKMMREKAEMQKRLAWEEAMRERCRNNEADSHSGE